MASPIGLDPGYIAALTRLRARNSLLELVGPARRDEVDAIRWQIDPWVIGKETVALHHRIRVAARRVDGQPSPDDSALRQSALVDARAWESLAAAEERVSRFAALVNSSVSYELAGYQANASCLARAAERSLGARPRIDLALTASAFVQRQFLRVAALSEQLSQPPDPQLVLNTAALDASLLDRGTEGLSEILTDDELAHLAAQAFAAQALHEAGLYFLSGDRDRLRSAAELLTVAAAGFDTVGAVRDANLVTNLQTLIPEMTRRSTWAVLGDRPGGGARWRRYLQVLARGLDDNLRESRSISELWPSQLAALDGGLLTTDSSMVVRMPTSAGKTRVAELAIVDTLLSKPGSTCLYIAPFRALAEEVEGALDSVLGEVGFSATSMLGGPENTGVEALLAQESQVLVLTPEKADLLLRSRPDLLADVALVVLDEGHIVGDETRGPRFELLISRLLRRLPAARFLFLSAVVPDLTLAEFASWLRAPDQHGIVSSTWRPAIQRVASFEWTSTGGILRYRRSSEGADEQAAFARFLPRLVPEQKFEFIKASTGRKNTRRFPDPTNRSHLIAALAYEFVKTGPVLMFCAQTNFAESCAKALADRIELAQLTSETAPDCFTRSRYPSADVAVAWLGADDPITKMLRVGVAVHHGRLPDAVRRAVEDDYRSGRIKVLAATTTLGQGVNLPVRTVLVHSVRRRDEDNNETRISARDYWNIAGRAGRAGFETDGLTVHLVLNNRDYEDLRFFLDQADSVEPVTSSLFAVLNNLAAQRISSEDALAELDPGLMALLVEEGADNIESLIAQVKPLLEGSLVGVQAATRNRPLNPLIDLATRGARDIADSIPFARLEAFAKTGLTSASCQRLVSHIDANRDRLLPLLTDSTRLPELISIMLNGISGLNEMQPRRAYDGDYEQLTLEWISGQSVPAIAANMTLPGNEAEVGATARAIEEVTSYLFPWGFSAYLQLAAHLLDTDPSIEVAAAPGLVRYGVPDPVAAWLLGFGLIDRNTAIAVAARYHLDSGENSPAQLRNWLAAQDPVLLAAAFPFEPDSTVRELSRAIRRISRPRLARDLGSGNLLPRSAAVYLGRDAPEVLAASRLTEGDTLSLLRDYDDVIDRNQIQVTSRGEPIGRLDAFSAALLAVEIDAGTSVIATVTGIPADNDVGVLSVDLREETNRSPA
jgi:superfamily II DNA/RNA helicase